MTATNIPVNAIEASPELQQEQPFLQKISSLPDCRSSLACAIQVEHEQEGNSAASFTFARRGLRATVLDLPSLFILDSSAFARRAQKKKPLPGRGRYGRNGQRTSPCRRCLASCCGGTDRKAAWTRPRRADSAAVIGTNRQLINEAQQNRMAWLPPYFIL